MSDDERARLEVLLEDVLSKVGAIAEGHGALSDQLGTLNARVAGVDAKVDRLAGEVVFLRTDLSQFKTDTGERLTRIEHHLGLNGAAKPSKPRSAAKRPRKKR